MRGYPRYRNSGVEWLGDVPEHWEVLPVRRLFNVLNGGTPTADAENWGGDIRWATPVDLARVNGGVLDETERTLTAEGLRSGSRAAPPTSLIVSTRAPIGYVAETATPMAFNQGCRGLIPRAPLDVRYFRYQCVSLRDQMTAIGQGSTFVELSSEALASLALCDPSLHEQHAIADYLDRATARIDTLIGKKRLLLERLDEQRTALISDVVTHGLPPDPARAAGLDPAPRLRASGVEWLGDVPEHWQVVPSRALFTNRNEKAETSEEILTASQAHGIVSRSDFMAREGRRVMEVVTGRDLLKQVQPNDFVISMRSFEGGLEWSRVRGAISSAYVMLIPSKEVHPPYYAFLLKTRSYIGALRRTSDLVRDGQALRYANFVQVPLPRVPLEEQQAIADYLERETTRIDELAATVREAVDRLAEYRTALITAAVTGQIDVTGASA